ncbi:MAG TPA: AAA domain-containing protein [Spirochaetota bacterium]|nr:AAA domain-containing protein [Spirochaetota bacterium]
MKKQKYLQIFTYLKEFSKLRDKPVRDIDTQESQYPEKLWLNDIVDNELFENVLRTNFDIDNDYWIKVKKPKEPIKPAFPKLSGNLHKWIEPASLISHEEEPKLKESIEYNGETVLSNDFPELYDELDNYINNKWHDDLSNYQESIKEYNIEFDVFNQLNNIYKQLFKIYSKTEQLGEEYELVIGVGLLNFKENENRPKIFRHVLTQRVDINFEYSQKDSQILVKLNFEAALLVENDFIIDLYEQFEAQNIVDAEKSILNYIKEKEIDSIFDNTNIEEALQMFAERISPNGSYISAIEKPAIINLKPIISFSPCLILRKRNTKSFTSLYDKILENIESETDSIDIPSINDLIYIDHQDGVDFSNERNIQFPSDDDTIYFPKEFNDEQIEIIKKASKSNKVLVQGPPGTGKSHTIANLICHLLAHGKKVLVTAYTKRALEVLKDKIPPEFQDLTVNLLSGDSSSLQDLQSSVNSINDELSRTDLREYEREINELEIHLKRTKEKISATNNEFLAVKEKTTRKHDINNQYTGTLTQIAESIEADSQRFEWYNDDYSDIDDIEIISDLQHYIDLYENYKLVDISDFNYEIPNRSKLPTEDQFLEYRTITDKIQKLNLSNYEKNLIKCANNQNYDKLKSMLVQLSEVCRQIESIQIDFVQNIIDSYLKGTLYRWRQVINNSTIILQKLKNHDLRLIDKDIEVSYPPEKSLKQLKRDAQILLTYIDEGNLLSGLTFALKKPFMPKEIKERLYFIDGIRVNGSPCDTLEEFKVVLRDIEIQQDLTELSELWHIEVPRGDSYFNKFNHYNHIHKEVIELLKLIEQTEILKNEIEIISNFKVDAFNRSDIEHLIRETENDQLLANEKYCKETFGAAEAYLNHNDHHPIKNRVLNTIKQFDYHGYSELIVQIEKLADAKREYQAFIKLKDSIERHLPNLLALIHADKFSKQNIPELQKAVFFRHAQQEMNKLMSFNYEQQIFCDLNDLEDKKRKLISNLAAKKAWFKVIQDLNQNRSLRQHLDAWVMAVKKIGKTGKGKRALKFRKLAQEEMGYCKNSVPCWIMPLYKVTETIQPELGMYDYIIIDEASQLGPEAIFLLFISKNIIIVGDDKQTSPEYIGVDANIMNPYIARHLEGIPFSGYYGTECSFFDHARRFCNGRTVLREHFRCMPEIIEFSNKYFYEPEGNSLYPLKQYSENRLKPIETVFCTNGYTDGIGSNIINEPEADRITETIAKLIIDKRYEDKTFGVITLQGNQQSNLIENLLIKRIGEKEFFKRKIICGISASFQGDERDIIFLSLVTAHNHNRAAFTKPEDERRFNVAVSRAKEQIWLFHSVQLEDLSNTDDLRYKLLHYFMNHLKPIEPGGETIPIPTSRSLGSQPAPFDSWFEVDVYNDIVRKGYRVIPQYEVAKGRYRIDLVVLFPDGTKIAIECDGDKWHGPEQYQNDVMRQRVLERCGWQFFRIRGYEYYANREKALESFWKIVPNSEEIDSPGLEQRVEISQKAIEVEVTEEIIENKTPHVTIERFTNVSEVENHNEIIRFFNLYNSGLYILTDKAPLDADYVIPINSKFQNGYLLQCYNSGHVNKVKISALLNKTVGRKYTNGFSNSTALNDLLLIDSEKILGIYFNEGGRRKFKAHKTENIPSREQLCLQGYKVMYNEFENIEYKILPLEIYNDIKRLVFNNFTASGKPLDNNYYEDEWATIRHHVSVKNEPLLKTEPIQKVERHYRNKKDAIDETPTLFEPKVELNNIVKLKYVDDDEILTVELVGYEFNGVDISEGVRKISFNTPIARSILGHAVGTKVRILNTDRYVEILKIKKRGEGK